MTEPSPEHELLNRPVAERLREYKYRFAQSTVFGLPVLALHFIGPQLGGSEAPRWIGLLEILLAGWVVYVGILAMIVEAIIRKRAGLDSVLAGAALISYLIAAFLYARLMVQLQPFRLMWGFPTEVMIAIVLNGMRWTMLTMHDNRENENTRVEDNPGTKQIIS